MSPKLSCKCQICKEELSIKNKYVLEYVTRKGTFSKKQGHENCVNDWYKLYTFKKPKKEKKDKIILARPRKCQICNILVDADNIFTLKYTNNNGNPSEKKGHESCVKSWIKDREDKESINEMLKYIFNIPDIPKSFFVQLSVLHQSYSWSVIRITIEEKEKAMTSNFDKGWRYIFAIISNSIAQIYKELQKQEERVISEPSFTKVFDINSLQGKQLDNTDYSRILDD